MLANVAIPADFWFARSIASKQASDIDSLWWFLCIVSLIMTVVIFVGVVFFAVKYRKRPVSELRKLKAPPFLK